MGHLKRTIARKYLERQSQLKFSSHQKAPLTEVARPQLLGDRHLVSRLQHPCIVKADGFVMQRDVRAVWSALVWSWLLRGVSKGHGGQEAASLRAR